MREGTKEWEWDGVSGKMVWRGDGRMVGGCQ